MRLLKLGLTKAQARRADMLSQGWKAFKLTPLTEQDAKFLHGSNWTGNAATIERLKAEIASAELDLALFNAQHPELEQ